MRFLQSTVQHWFSYTIFAYLFTFFVWRFVVLPLEISVTSENAIFASWFFLPHAVRVLSAWLLGPKSILAMLPAGVVVGLMGYGLPTQGYELFLQVVVEAFSAISAVIAFEFMRFCKIDAYPKDIGVISWRTVLFGGVLASIINSLGSSWLKSGFFASSELMEVIARFILGDILGLLFGMIIIMVILRQLRQMA
jgi:hypothetical protein